MAIPVLIDTDAGADGAVALSLALASDALEVCAVVGVGGSVGVGQAMANLDRLLAALAPPSAPAVGRGLDPGIGREIDPAKGAPADRRAVFGADGLGGWAGSGKSKARHAGFRRVYQRAIEEAGGELVVLALGPLSNLAAVLAESPAWLGRVRQVYVCGGAVWARGNAGERAEFNFQRDAAAAAAVLSSGLPITVVPLDVSGLVCLDQSHVAHLAASGTRTGELSARVLERALAYEGEPAAGKVFVPAAVTVGSLLWPGLFMKTRMRLEVTLGGAEAGRSCPALGGDTSKQVDLLTAVNAVDLLENLLECLCHEAFIV